VAPFSAAARRCAVAPVPGRPVFSLERSARELLAPRKSSWTGTQSQPLLLFRPQALVMPREKWDCPLPRMGTKNSKMAAGRVIQPRGIIPRSQQRTRHGRRRRRRSFRSSRSAAHRHHASLLLEALRKLKRKRMLDLPPEQQEVQWKKQHTWLQACYSVPAAERGGGGAVARPTAQSGASAICCTKTGLVRKGKSSGAGATKMTKPRAVARLTVALARAGDGLQQRRPSGAGAREAMRETIF